MLDFFLNLTIKGSKSKFPGRESMNNLKILDLVNRLFASQYHLPLDTFLADLGRVFGLKKAAIYYNRLDHRWQLVAHRISSWEPEESSPRFPDTIDYQKLFPGLETKVTEGPVRLRPLEVEALGFLREREHVFYVFPVFEAKWWAGVLILDFGPREPEEDELSLLAKLAESLSLALKRQKRESEYLDVSRVFQELLNHVPDLVLLVDAQGRWLLANRNLLNLLQFKRNVYHGRHFREIAELRPGFRPLLEKLEDLRRQVIGRDSPLKEIVPFKSGEKRFWWEFCLIFFRCDEEKRILILGRDITSLKLAQERLLTILENLPAMVYVVHPATGRILYHNSSFREYFGAHLIGREPCYRVLFGQEAPCNFCRLREARAGLKEVREFYDRRRGRWLRSHEVYIPWLDESLVRLGMMEDVTQFKRHEEELIRSQKMELLGKMTGNVAHEFNNILTIVGGYLDLLRTRIQEDEKVSLYLDRIQKAVESGSKMIKQLLILSRGRLEESENGYTELNTAIREQIDLIRKLLGEKIELETKLCEQPLPIRLSFEEVQHILTNLIINARDAMPFGGKLTIETRQVETTEKGPCALLRVSDTGQGISQEALAHIFEPFYTTKAPGEGSGLGLNIILSLVKRAGGEIKVESELKKGTTFEILLPLEKEVRENGQKDLPRSSIEGPKVTKQRILVVEDEPHIREMLAEMLEGQNFEVITASNGQEALDWLREHNYEVDLIITDVVMPKMDGVELYRHLQREAPHLIIIFISGYAEHVLQKYGFDEKSFRILKKPFTFRQLLEEIKKVLD